MGRNGGRSELRAVDSGAEMTCETVLVPRLAHTENARKANLDYMFHIRNVQEVHWILDQPDDKRSDCA
eukprot:10205-Eustigmatos_ZCMA.PRE.1